MMWTERVLHSWETFVLHFLLVLAPTVYCQRNVSIGFLLDVGTSVNKSVFLDWGDSCCNNVSATADIDVIYIDPASSFDTQVTTYLTTNEKDITVVIPNHCDYLPSINSAAATTGGNLIAMTPLYCWTAASISQADSVPPSLTPLMSTIQAFITTVRWKEAMIFHDHDHETILTAILHTVTEVKFKPVNITGLPDQKLLDMMIETHDRNGALNQYILLCDLSGIIQVFSQAQKVEDVIQEQGFIDYYSQWLLLTETTSLNQILPHIAGINNVDAIILNAFSDTMTKFINKNLNRLTYEVENIIIGRGSISCSSEDCLYMNVVPPMDANVPVYVVHGAWETLNNAGNKELRWNKVASWNEQTQLKLHAISLYPARSYGFNQKRLKIGTVDRMPYMQTGVNTSSPIPAKTYTGFCMAMIDELAFALNFSYDIVLAGDNSIGIQDENGNWNGLVQMLRNKEIDLAVAPMAVTKDRSNVIDFTYPFHVDQFAILYKRIDPASMKWRLMVEPFKWEVWSGVILSVFVSAAFVWVTSRFTPYYKEEERVDGLGSKGYALFYTYGALLQQGCVYEPSALSGRFIVGFWWFYCMCVIATYQGNLIAFLTVPIEFLPFQSINELIYSSNIKYGFLGNTGLESVLQNSSDQLFMDMWDKVKGFAEKDPSVLDTNVSLHISRVESSDEKYAFFTDKTTIQQSISQYCGNLNFMEHNIWMVQYAIAFPTGSTYPRLFSDLILQFHESGLIDTWRFRYFKKEASCTNSESLAEPVTMDDVFGPLMAFGVLTVICLAVFSGEHFWRWKKRKQNARSSSADSQSKIIKSGSQPAEEDYPSTPTKKSSPANHDPYSVDPELLAKKEYYSYGVGPETIFDGNFYNSDQFVRKVDDVRVAYDKSKNNKNRKLNIHGNTSRASDASGNSPATSRSHQRSSKLSSAISPVESPGSEA